MLQRSKKCSNPVPTGSSTLATPKSLVTPLMAMPLDLHNEVLQICWKIIVEKLNNVLQNPMKFVEKMAVFVVTLHLHGAEPHREGASPVATRKLPKSPKLNISASKGTVPNPKQTGLTGSSKRLRSTNSHLKVLMSVTFRSRRM